MHIKDEGGYVLVMSLGFLSILTMLAIYISTQSGTGLKISTALRDHESSFNLGDGASQIGLGYIDDVTVRSSQWNPTDEHVLVNDTGFPDYMFLTTLGDGESYTPQIWWEGYNTDPLPGWQLNWQGYSAYHQNQYQAMGTGTVPRGNSTSSVYSLVVKMVR